VWIGPAAWDQVKALPDASNPELVVRRLPADAQTVVRELARRHTPLRRYIFRNTRGLLREYHKKGLLKENIPYRDPRQVWIELRPDAWELYQRIEQYIRHHYQKYEAERKGLGFIMTVYRRRLTSSFYAIARLPIESEQILELLHRCCAVSTCGRCVRSRLAELRFVLR